MPIDQLVVLSLGLVFVAVLAGVVAYATAQTVGRRASPQGDEGPGERTAWHGQARQTNGPP